MEKYYKREGRRFVQVELLQTPTITTNNAGKYYQSDGTFVNERTKDSIGLCIISLSTGHVVMALEDCAGEYTHDEAIDEVKKHFNGKGEIPEVNEMLTAMISYKKALGLEYYVDYRAVCFGSLTANVHYTGTTTDHTPRTGYYVGAHIGSSWMSYCIRLRPIVRIK